MTRRRVAHAVRAASLALLVGLLVATLLPSAAAASQVEGQENEFGSGVVDGGSFPRATDGTAAGGKADDREVAGGGVWFSPSARRAYYLKHPDNTFYAFKEIVAYDVDSRQEAARATLSPPAYGGNRGSGENGGLGGSHSMAVDDAGQRLFVLYSSPTEGSTAPLDATGTATRGDACLHPLNPARSNAGLWKPVCVAGVMTLDAISLERKGPLMPLRVVSASGAPVAAQALAIEYSPARGAGDRDKILLLVTDYVANSESMTADNNPRNLASLNPTYAVQFDVETGAQEWVVAIDACRGTRNKTNASTDLETRRRPHPAAIYRHRGLETPMVVVACHSGSTQTGTLVRIPLDDAGHPHGLPVRAADQGAITDELKDPASAAPQNWVAQSPPTVVTVGPEKVMEMIADPISDRVLLKVVDGSSGQEAEVWWVYDAKLGAFAGTIGIGAVPGTSATSHATLDTQRGRLYVLTRANPERGFSGGLFMADIRRTPLAQALVYPAFGTPEWTPSLALFIHVNSAVLPPTAAGQPALLFTPDSADHNAQYRVIEDWVPVTTDVETASYEGRTLDLEEQEGVTQASLDGAARGYSVRALLVGGAEAAARVGPLDPLGQVYQCNGNKTRTGGFGLCGVGISGLPTPPLIPGSCVQSNPEIVLGFVGPEGPNVVDGTGARGSAEPVRLDSGTAADLEAPVSRCSGTDWEDLGTLPVLGGTKLFSGVVDEPSVASPWAGRTSECVSSGEPATAREGDAVSDTFAAASSCEEEEASGFAYVRGNQIGDLNVGEALSSFRIYRDPVRGIVSRVESVTRGISLAGILRIDTVRGVAESWANGRNFTPPVLEEGQSYDPNCDRERTAGTCFERSLIGLWTAGYSCGPCGDEQRAVTAMNRALGSNGTAALRNPDPALARGADNGFIAAITKRAEDRFSDLVLNNDLLQTVLPTLEIVRFTAPNRLATGGGPRGRQIYQFAGVEVSSSYGIQCLLVYDAETETCSEAPLPSGSLTVSLVDAAGEPLAGGVFEVRADVDADGVVGLLDELLGEGACVTAADGVGTCSFDNLEPGSYLVSQTAAPPGYSAVAEPWVSEVTSGEARTVTFTNASNVSVIEVSATDAAGDPVEGATFAVFPDPDADGKVASDVEAAATCTTDATGVCAMEVPAGSYVLVQTVAPVGLEPIEPVAFAFASGGQTAAVGVTNAPAAGAATPDAPPPQASPVYSPPSAVAPPVESIRDTGPVIQPAAPQVSVPERVGGTVTQVIRAPGDALRLLSRDPLQAVAWVASLVLFALAAIAVARRRQTLALIDR